ncbi:DMT family transporter [Vibrio rotiferianus]
MLNSERKAAFVLVATTMIAALGWIFSKETIQGLPPFGFIGLRFTIASLCLLPLCIKPLRAANKKDIFAAAGVGVLLGGALMCWIHAISISDTLGAALMLALHFNVNSKYSQKLPVLLLTCIQLFVTGLIGLLISSLVETVPTEVSTSIWIWFALSTLLATSLRYVMQTMGQKFVQAGNAALIMILEPVWTVVLSVIWYGEVLTSNKLVGCALILFSLVIYRTGGKLRFLKRA